MSRTHTSRVEYKMANHGVGASNSGKTGVTSTSCKIEVNCRGPHSRIIGRHLALLETWISEGSALRRNSFYCGFRSQSDGCRNSFVSSPHTSVCFCTTWAVSLAHLGRRRTLTSNAPTPLLFQTTFQYSSLPKNCYTSRLLFMSPPPLSPKANPKSKTLANGDHRKRRRTRCTQSCMNCHATKRMCDRKRPCSRCSQLGLSGTCVYEVDDPSRQGKQGDVRLMGRIAELEGVIRELKQKPHPRWLSEQDSASSTSDGSRSSPSSGPPTPNVPVWAFPSSPRYNPPSGSPPQFPPQASGPSSAYRNDAWGSLLSMYAGLSEHMFIRKGGKCGCLDEAACYKVVLDLSLRLRKAADVLARFPGHPNNSVCVMNTRISELDTLVKNLVLNFPNRSALSSDLGTDLPSISSTRFDQHYSHNDGTFFMGHGCHFRGE